MCDKDFSSPTSLDITDLLEYDEYALEPTDGSSDTSASAATSSPPALPLSAELALAGVPSLRLGHAPDAEAFAKSSELFLRLDDGGGPSGVGDEAGAAVFAGGIELQYENEFEEDGGRLGEEASRSFHSMAENENEQLLMEGSLWCNCPQFCR